MSDRDLSYLAQLLREKRRIIPISHENAAMAKHFYIVQWENIIQSFDIGIMYLMGYIRLYDTSSHTQKLEPSIMQLISFDTVWNRDCATIFDLIQYIHKEHNIMLSDAYMQELITEIVAHVESDTTGILFTISPTLIMLSSLVELYHNDYMKAMIIVINENDCRNCKQIPSTILKRYFDNIDTCPIYVDFRTVPFIDYVLSYNEPYAVENSVIITTDSDLIYQSFHNKKLSNITIIAPEYPLYHIHASVFIELKQYVPFNEYIWYAQKIK